MLSPLERVFFAIFSELAFRLLDFTKFILAVVKSWYVVTAARILPLFTILLVWDSNSLIHVYHIYIYSFFRPEKSISSKK